MTENKRFVYNVHKHSIEKDNKHFAYFNGEELKIVKKLNELNDENGRLQHFESIYRQRTLQLEKENEQLKSKYYWYKQYKELLNENEQLKQFIQELTTKGTAKIHLANGGIYKVDAILSDFKGD